jgi:hypothetical protein
MAGSAIGAKRTCTVLGLAAGTGYQFQLVAFRGTMNLNAVYGGLSNVASGTTALSVTLPSGGSNEPAGFKPITDRSFDALAELSWGASALLALATDLSAPHSAPWVGQVTYPAGFGGGYDPAFTWLAGVEGRGYRELYVSFWVKLSSNWQGHSSGVNKIGFVWLHNDPVVYFSAQGSGSGLLEAQVRLQNIPGVGARNLTPNVSNPSYTRGQWHHWEVVLVVNSGDQANGEAHWWIDGVKVGQYTDIVYGSSGQGKAWGDEVSWKPTWGGAGETVPQTMYMWMDHYYLSGR